MTLSVAEQYLLELINRARLDPQAEANRYNLALNDNLEAGTITGDTLQVLAPNSELNAAATAHSEWMLSANTFSHTGQNGSNPGERMEAAGYEFTGSWTWRENLAWVGTTGTIDLDAAIEDHHEGLYRSAGHRVNTFTANVSEVGLGQVEGMYTQNRTTYNSSMLTENFAASGGAKFVTGVAYRDTDGDLFYSIGEGRSNVWFNINDGQSVTQRAGGYGYDVGSAAQADVTIGSGATTFGSLTIDMDAGNAKLDLVTDASGNHTVALSASTTLQSGLNNATLLGVADLNLTGHNGSNVLTGNRGDNVMFGLSGRDVMRGAGGDDRIDGGGSNDYLFGAEGHDDLMGRSGDDRLAGGNGRDRLWGGDQNDRLDGQGGNDRLDGGRGFDDLMGRSGEDILLGGAARDRLWGGDGNDRIDGQAGNDRMDGGRGADTFIFSGGNDVIVDFADNVDTIQLRGSIRGIGDMTVAEVLDMGSITAGGHAYFNFGNGHRLTVIGVNDMDMLANDLVII